MHANYAEFCRVGNLKANFQQVPLVQIFFEIFTKLLLNIKKSNSAKESNKYFLRKKFGNTLLLKLHT